MNETAALAPAPATYPAAEAVAAVARPRVQRIHRGTGFYPVTVGGYVVGAVAKVDGRWSALDEHGDDIGEGRATRQAAVAVVAATEGAAEAYRVAAREGAFGFGEQHAALAYDEQAEQAEQDGAHEEAYGDGFDTDPERDEHGQPHPGDLPTGTRLTWCARDCTTLVDLDADPAQDENGEALCTEHAQTLCQAGPLFAAGWECRTVADGSIMTTHGTRPACARHRALWETLPEVDAAPAAPDDPVG